MNTPLPHRIPGHPGYHYYLASGGWWVHGPAGFVGLFATRRDFDQFVTRLTGGGAR